MAATPRGLDLVREVVLGMPADGSAEDRLLTLEDLADELSGTQGAAGPEQGLDRFWVALLLAFHEGEGSARDDEALALVRSLHGDQADLFGQFWCLTIAIEHFGVRQFEDAERFAAFGLARFAPQPEYAQELWRLRARIALETGRIHDAKARLDELTRSVASLAGIPAPDRARIAANVEGEWAGLWMSLGVMDRAAEHLARAEELARQAGAPVPELFPRRADFLLLSEDFERLVEEIGRWKAAGDPQNERLLSLLELYLGVAESELEREGMSGAGPRAERTLRALAAHSTDALTDAERARIWIDLADLRLRAEDPPGAAEDLGRARLLLGGSLASGELGALLTVVEARAALARGASREELLLLRSACSRHFDELLASWAATLHPPGGIGFLHQASRRQVLCTLIELVLRTEEAGADEAADLVLRAQSTAALGAGWTLSAPASVERLRRTFLDEAHGVLVYVPGKFERSSHLFLLDRQGTRHVPLAARDELRKAIGPLEQALAVHPGTLDASGRAFLAARLTKASRDAARALLPEEIRRWLAACRELTVVGGELIGTIPFEALALQDGRLLGQACAVSTLPSLAVGLALAERPLPEFEFDLGLVASLELDSGLREHADVARSAIAGIRLRDADLERLTGAARAASRWTLVGSAADQAALLAAAPRVRATRVVDFLLHGVYLRDLERGSALLLPGGKGGEASFLTADEVERSLELQGAVLLSSCGSGLGPERLGDDNLANLGGAFLRAGARAVVLSRAPLELGATIELMGRVHAEILAGTPPAEALRRARVERAQRVDSVDAFADTGIQAVGLGHRSLRPPAVTKERAGC
jgi:tetratricopeptide (TPR) repeat protein